MAKIKKNTLLQGLSGSIGDLVFRQMPDGSTRVSKKPDFSERDPSQRQLDHQNRFKLAIAYGREAKTLPFYQERAGNGKTAYNLAIADWCHAPVIHSIERYDGRIRVKASDNFKVTKIEVRILDDKGNILEAGQAEQVNPLYWEYAYSAEGQVEASAWDQAGNRTVVVWQKSAKTS